MFIPSGFGECSITTKLGKTAYIPRLKENRGMYAVFIPDEVQSVIQNAIH